MVEVLLDCIADHATYKVLGSCAVGWRYALGKNKPNLAKAKDHAANH